MSVGTTVHAYRHLVDLPPIAARSRFRPTACARRFCHWDELAIALFDQALETGGVYHLWGHSWEVDAHGDWDRLERACAHIGNRTDVTYITNGQLALPR